ncbi:MAG TPA: UDP-N-acetylmuramoyl-L-alanyl-D-glutamate--2,6-diaminopimelate ligase [Solirubrobacteraceae bacterium]|jgi:UDP-N-acetylmuramoyl-L-alanyl-D-glutamate--2,6-diaminopimelate ligase|nr:UDP-N-acetylmuramoyl-L-alanyl-D-glutamate--2,6-diaminopimelate ligase [Solirubrobacteraceae bacterium]
MLLSELSQGSAPVEITALAYDSRTVGPGTLFFCVSGARSDGHEYAAEAVRRGASALVVERALSLGVPELKVASVREAMAPLAARFYTDPSGALRVVGITGTNGKTTTAFLTRQILEAAGEQCGLLGTIKSVIGGVDGEVIHTTPEAIDLQASFAAMRDAGDRACAMEVSSHALALHRADATHFAAAVFTNLTQDHLDFHPDMEAYFAAKRILFESAPGVSVVNADDGYGRRLLDDLPDAVSYAIDTPADYRASELRSGVAGASFSVLTPDGELAVTTRLPGAFNVANALAALAVTHRLGVPLERIADALAVATPAPGRFQALDEGQRFTVLVDYAHTPDSLERVLCAARGLTEGQLICVFGCGGDRDRDKRAQMGRISSELADISVVTSDNPRSEDPAAIVQEILAGAHVGGEHAVEAIVERREAIAHAISLARSGDTVVIAGKGHEQGQEFADGRKIPFDDADVARAQLRPTAAHAQ